jgi:hypothetical protein
VFVDFPIHRISAGNVRTPLALTNEKGSSALTVDWERVVTTVARWCSKKSERNKERKKNVIVTQMNGIECSSLLCKPVIHNSTILGVFSTTINTTLE